MKKLISNLSRAVGMGAPRPVTAGQGLHLRALEPRILLDAAAAATAAETMAQVQAATQDMAAHDNSTESLLHALATPAPQSEGDAAAAQPQALVFIDSNVADRDMLIAAIGSNAEVHVIGPDQDGVRAIADALQGRTDVDSIHIVSHGTAGALALGNTALSADSMAQAYGDLLQGMRTSLSADADILIYGCDFGAGEAGQQAAQLLAELTGADVAASTDATGAAALGGDWELETQVGAVETAVVFDDAAQAQWQHLLAPVVDLNGAGAGSDNTVSYTENAGPTLIAPNATITSMIAAVANTVTVTLTDAQSGDQITVDGSTANSGSFGNGLTWTRSGNTITINAPLIALATQDRFEAALRLVGYQSSSDNPTLGGTDTARTFQVRSTDALGTSAVTTATVNITPLNDAPVLSAGTRTLSTINEDNNSNTAWGAPSGAVGTPVSSFIGTTSDIDTGAAALGVAITAADSINGTWWYSTNNGTSWTALGSVSESAARTILTGSGATAGRLYFQPNGDFNGTATLTIRAWDQTGGTTNGGTVDASTNGAGTSVSAASNVATITVNPLVDITSDNINGANSVIEDGTKTVEFHATVTQEFHRILTHLGP